MRNEAWMRYEEGKNEGSLPATLFLVLDGRNCILVSPNNKECIIITITKILEKKERGEGEGRKT